MAAVLALALAAAGIFLPPWPLSPDGELVAVEGGTRAHRERRVGRAGRAGALPRDSGARTRGAWRSPRAERARRRRWSRRPGDRDRRRTSSAGEGPRRRGRDRDRGPAPRRRARRRRAPSGARRGAGPDLRDLAPAGPGRFRAIYEPADGPQPEVAVLLALVPRCPLCPTPRAVGGADRAARRGGRAPRRGRARARARPSRRRARLRPGRRGRARPVLVPLVIPPGVRRVARRSRSTRREPHRLPRSTSRLRREVDRLACARVAAGAARRRPQRGGRSGASPSTPRGEPAPGGAACLAASAQADASGRSSPWRGALQRARYRAPAGGAREGRPVRRATPGRRRGVARRHRTRARAGAPARDRRDARARAGAARRDRRGRDAPVRDARGDVLGRATRSAGRRRRASSRRTASSRRPRRRAGAAGAARVRAARRAARPRPLDAAARGEPLDRRGARRWTARPPAGCALRFGAGAQATTDARGEARAPAAGRGETVVAAGGARAAGWAGIAPPAAPFEISRDVEIALRPPSPVDVVARVEGRALALARRGRRGPPAPRPARRPPRATASRLGPAERDGDGGRAAIRRAGAASSRSWTTETGVAAVVEVPR